MFVAVLIPACATAPPRVVVDSPDSKDVFAIAPLNIRFAEVHFDRVPIWAAVDRMAEAVHQVYGRNYAFSPAFISVKDPLMRGPRPNPRESFHGTDVSTRDVFSSICQQVGWSYEWTKLHYLQFQDGPGLGHSAESAEKQ